MCQHITQTELSENTTQTEKSENTQQKTWSDNTRVKMTEIKEIQCSWTAHNKSEKKRG
jgi:hypothetical protein